ncbi:diguanylate cyclase [Neptuniibacter sp. QD37_6]|uniref:sensor domain-containing diguanylate cyclase n=1 Tax=Neptuniibacter sp. QD37_6 TaxID=3398210 RepID=UPI0039F46BAD
MIFLLPVHAGQSIENSFAVEPFNTRYLQETEGTLLHPNQALKDVRSKGARSQSDILNFGLGAPPVWVHFEVSNYSETEQLRYIQLENTWLDHVHLYIFKDGQMLQKEIAGDAILFEKNRTSRFFSFPYYFQPGDTSVLIRVETPEPQLLPLFVLTEQDMLDRKIKSGYEYGIIYGFLTALLIYNVLLYFSLRSRRYLFYSLYLASFIILNMAYTGHALKWIWPNWPEFQNQIIPPMMMLFAYLGILFCREFLSLPKRFPRINTSFNLLSAFMLCSVIWYVLSGNYLAMLVTAFISVIPFALLMISAGVVACYEGVKEAKYFLGAAIFAMISAIVTAFTVSGIVEYQPFGFHAVEYGILIEAVLFALALAYQFRISQAEKIEAQRLADRDQLTGLYNRRGFQKVIEPIYSNATRNNRNICVMLMDIDRFKDINDNFGHSFGDLVLLDLSGLLMRELRAGDIIARWGGEEFILVLPETQHDEAITLAERLIGVVSNQVVQQQQTEVQYTVSIGISEMKDPIDSISTLIDNADHYLYKAKAAGRNRVAYQVDQNCELDS